VPGRACVCRARRAGICQVAAIQRRQVCSHQGPKCWRRSPARSRTCEYFVGRFRDQRDTEGPRTCDGRRGHREDVRHIEANHRHGTAADQSGQSAAGDAAVMRQHAKFIYVENIRELRVGGRRTVGDDAARARGLCRGGKRDVRPVEDFKSRAGGGR